MISITTEVSDSWNEGERRACIDELSSRLRATIFNNTFNFGHANDCLERISLIATWSKEQLNDNRDSVLNGNK